MSKLDELLGIKTKDDLKGFEKLVGKKVRTQFSYCEVPPFGEEKCYFDKVFHVSKKDNEFLFENFEGSILFDSSGLHVKKAAELVLYFYRITGIEEVE